MTGTSSVPTGRSGLRLGFQILCIALGVYALFGALTTIAFDMQPAPPIGTLRATLTPTNIIGRNHLVVSDLTPSSPLYAAGIRNGDRIDFDQPGLSISDVHLLGEPLGVTRLTPEGPVHVTIYPAPKDMTSPAGRLGHVHAIIGSCIDGLTTLISVIVGALLVLRSRGSWAMLMLGFTFFIFDSYPPLPWQASSQMGLWPILSLGLGQETIAPISFVAFAVLFYREHVGQLKPWNLYALAVGGMTLAALGLMTSFDAITGVSLGDATLGAVFPWAAQTAYVITLIGLFAGWRASRQDLQKRYALMCVALAAILLADCLFVLGSAADSDVISTRVLFAQSFSAFGHILFGYAVLRHRVIDLGFAVNRTLVYGVLSTLLLLAFGLIEWATEHFLPFKGIETNILLDAGLALVIFLVFHRVRDFVEQTVEKILFSRWHHNEEKLRTFVRQAGFIGKSDALVAGFIAELRRFSGGAEASLFMAGDGDFTSGKVRVDGDDASVVAMKADHAPVETADALYLPMSHRSDLTGFVRLGLKPSGDAYRPDEREVLAWATQQIGLDLHALKVEALEQRVKTLDTQLAFVVASGLGKVKKVAT